jgi:ZIP family zinc transporter
VLAGGTAAEELIEGLSIGVGVAIQPGLAVIVGASIALDNLSEALSIGALIAEKDHGSVRTPAARRRVLWWTGAIGGALFSSSVVSWLLLRTVSPEVLGLLIAVGAGGMFYLCVTELVPEAELRHYQHSSALAAAIGFVIILVLSAR